MASAQLVDAQPVKGVSYADAAAAPPPADDPNVLLDSPPDPLMNGNDAPQLPTPGEYVGAGMDSAPKSPVRGHKKVSSRGSRNSLRQASKEQRPPYPDEVVLAGTNGDSLTSIKPSYDYEESIQLDNSQGKNMMSNKLELVSGRTPSAGWERSG
jgi:2-acylglycerol O-acyltransferase 2